MRLTLDPAEIARLHAVLADQERTDGAAPVDTEAMIAAAAAAIGNDDVDDALALLRVALVQDPKDARAWSLVARAYERGGDLASARRAAEHAASLDDDDLATCLFCAELQHASGDDDAARALVGFVLRGHPSDDVKHRAEQLFDLLSSKQEAGA